MKLAKVIGNVVATVKTPSHQNTKLMVVEPVDGDGKSIGDSFIAVDGAQAGIGDVVLIVEEGGSARQIMGNPEGAVDSIIVGIVDEVNGSL
ncbi:EutN/CcmL family microcompartment protein [Evansella tamaricis]|uniref:EutN/CcmL family microcompartment protein n=1 Tax=Evansella tamaricis TaxID=2069301 RepID=A0ABS6JE66_9BACI|nr:EutN/CcmL family microcompartment protein [Evansella tamaricis]MBU9711970.1 EutN/CcmL family microcompartment protein [Evansella tamaricis]